MGRGKTIQIYLPEGNPRGIKIGEITSSIVKAVFIPRNKLNDLSDKPELKGLGLYFLFGENDEIGRPVTYIGEAENLINRIKEHNRAKDFWNTAILFISEKDNINKAHAKFLESFCYDKAKEVNRCILENTVKPVQSRITNPERDFLMDFFDDLKVIIGVLGFPIFEDIGKSDDRKIYYCKGKQIEAKGKYTEEGFIILKGSKASIQTAKSISKGVIKKREKLIEDGIISKGNDALIFNMDVAFPSPSAASDFVLGSSTNGWEYWKNREGKSLDEIERKPNS